MQEAREGWRRWRAGGGPDARFSFPDRRHSFYSEVYPGVSVPPRLISCPSSLPYPEVYRGVRNIGSNRFSYLSYLLDRTVFVSFGSNRFSYLLDQCPMLSNGLKVSMVVTSCCYELGVRCTMYDACLLP